jgi:hypothetical protein
MSSLKGERRNSKVEDGWRKSDVRGQRSDVRDQRSEGGWERDEGGRMKDGRK